MFAYKIVLLGDFGVGKTSLIKRFVDNSFSEEYISTIGVSISKKNLLSPNGTESTMMIWDTEGKTEHKPIFKQYLTGAKAFIIVTDLTRPNTLESLTEHIKTCQEFASEIPIFIALNKSDLKNDFITPLDEIKSLSKNISHVYKTSAKSGDTVNTIFEDINSAVIMKS